MANFPSTLNYYLSFTGYANNYTRYYLFYDNNTQLNTQKRLIDNSEVCIVGFGKIYFGKNHAVLMFGYEIKSDSSSVSDIRTIYYHDPWYGSARQATLNQWADYTLVTSYRTSIAKAAF